MWLAELVTPDSPSEHLRPHLEATVSRSLASFPSMAHFDNRLTENLVSHIVFPDEVSEEFLVDPSLVDDGRIPKRAAEFNGFE